MRVRESSSWSSLTHHGAGALTCTAHARQGGAAAKAPAWGSNRATWLTRIVSRVRVPPSAPRVPVRAQPKATKGKKAAAPPQPYDPPKASKDEPTGPQWEKKPKNFGIGGDIRPKTDMGRFVAWPKYVRLQRQRKILYQRLKVPPSINQFSDTLDKQLGAGTAPRVRGGNAAAVPRLAARASARARGVVRPARAPVVPVASHGPSRRCAPRRPAAQPPSSSSSRRSTSRRRARRRRSASRARRPRRPRRARPRRARRRTRSSSASTTSRRSSSPSAPAWS